MRISNQSTESSIDKLPQAAVLNSQPAIFKNILSSTAHPESERTASKGESPVTKKRDPKSGNDPSVHKSQAESSAAAMATPVAPTLPVAEQARQGGEAKESTSASTDVMAIPTSGSQTQGASQASQEPVAEVEASGIPGVDNLQNDRAGVNDIETAKVIVSDTGSALFSPDSPEVAVSGDGGSGPGQDSTSASQLAGFPAALSTTPPQPPTIPDLGAQVGPIPSPTSGDGKEAIAEPVQGVASKVDGTKMGSSAKERSSSADVRSKRKPGEGESDIDGSPKAASHFAEKILVEAPHSTRSEGGAQSDAAGSSLQASSQPTDVLGKDVKAAEGQQSSANSETSAGSASTATASSDVLAPEAKSALSSAQLIQSMNHSEMRLGMNSSEFGNLSINTSLTRQLLSAQISTDHPELGRALAMHLPAMEEKLGNTYGLQTRFQLHDGASASSGGSGQQSSGDGQRSSTTSSSSSSGFRTGGVAPLQTSVAADTARLDIRI